MVADPVLLAAPEGQGHGGDPLFFPGSRQAPATRAHIASLCVMLPIKWLLNSELSPCVVIWLCSAVGGSQGSPGFAPRSRHSWPWASGFGHLPTARGIARVRGKGPRFWLTLFCTQRPVLMTSRNCSSSFCRKPILWRRALPSSHGNRFLRIPSHHPLKMWRCSCSLPFKWVCGRNGGGVSRWSGGEGRGVVCFYLFVKFSKETAQDQRMHGGWGVGMPEGLCRISLAMLSPVSAASPKGTVSSWQGWGPSWPFWGGGGFWLPSCQEPPWGALASLYGEPGQFLLLLL